MKNTTSTSFSARSLICLLFLCFCGWSHAEIICIGNTLQLSAPGTPATVNPWVSSDPAIASVNATGLASGNAMGTCTITYTDDLGTITVFNILVPDPNPSIPLVSGTSGQYLNYNTFVPPNQLIYTTMTPIVYAIPAGYSASVTGLPNGVTGVFANGQLVISGTAFLTTSTLTNTNYTYTVSLTPLFGCGSGGPNSGYGGGSVTVNGLITLGPSCISPPLMSPTQTICIGSQISYSSASISHITGLPPGVMVNSFGFQGTPTVTGTFNVIVYCYTSCSGILAAAPGTITVLPAVAPPTITAGGPTTFCQGGSVTLTSSSPTGNTWSTGATTQSITVSASGTYSVTRTQGQCASTPATQTVVVHPIPPVPTVSASGSLTFCDGGSVTLTSSASTGNLWSNGQTTQSITVSEAGNYSVTTVQNGCASGVSLPTVVIVNPIPSPPTVAANGSLAFCDGGSVTLTSSSETGNAWSDGSSTQSITVTEPGTYSTTVTQNGCSSPASSPIAVTVNAVPSAPTVSANGALTFCEGGSVTLTSSAATGNTWSNGATTQSITVSEAGNYSVNVTENGCSSSETTPVTVTVNTIPTTPTITADGPLTFCEGGSVTLTSSSASGNMWSTSETTQNITVSESGTYTVLMTENGCSSSPATVDVVVTPLPATPTLIASGPLTFCEGGSVTLTSSATNGNTWSTGETSQSITISESGSYMITVAENGCSSAAVSFEVVQHDSPDVSIADYDPMCSYDAAFVLAEGTPAGGTYTVSGVTATSFDPATANATNLVVYAYTNAAGCSGWALTTILVDDCLSLTDQELQNVQVYPNPANDHLTFDNVSGETIAAAIYDASGRLVVTLTLEPGKQQTDAGALASGLYQVVFVTKATRSSQKLTIAH